MNAKACWYNPRVLTVLVLIFLTGAAVGAVLATLWWNHQVEPMAAGFNLDESGKRLTLEQLKSELGLTEEQARQLEEILDDFFMYYRELKTQMDDVRAKGKRRIMRILNEDQKQKFERMLADLKEDKNK